MGRYHSQACSEIGFGAQNEIYTWLITYLPGKLNAEADEQSRKFSDQTEWKLNPKLFTIFFIVQKGTKTSHWFICHTSKLSTITLDFLETKPRSHRRRCLHNKLEQVDSCERISIFQSNPQGSLQAGGGPSRWTSSVHFPQLANNCLLDSNLCWYNPMWLTALKAPTNSLNVSSNEATFDSKTDADTEGQRNTLTVIKN